MKAFEDEVARFVEDVHAALLRLKKALGEVQAEREDSAAAIWQRLSPAETKVLQLLCEGHSNRDIAAALFVSVPTVKTHVRSILGALGVKRRTEAIALILKTDFAARARRRPGSGRR